MAKLVILFLYAMSVTALAEDPPALFDKAEHYTVQEPKEIKLGDTLQVAKTLDPRNLIKFTKYEYTEAAYVRTIDRCKYSLTGTPPAAKDQGNDVRLGSNRIWKIVALTPDTTESLDNVYPEICNKKSDVECKKLFDDASGKVTMTADGFKGKLKIEGIEGGNLLNCLRRAGFPTTNEIPKVRTWKEVDSQTGGATS